MTGRSPNMAPSQHLQVHVSYHRRMVKIGRLFVAAAFAGCLATVAHAAVIAEHAGEINPESEGWFLNDGGVIVGGGVETTSTGAHSFWEVWDAITTGGGGYAVIPDLTVFSGDWTFEASLRVVDSPMVPGNSVPGTGIIVRDGSNYWSFYIGNDRVGPVSPYVTLARTHFMETRDDYHSYKIRFFANGTGSYDDSADFYVDDVLVFANVSRSEMFPAPDHAIGFGGVSTVGTSRAFYERVHFEDGTTLPSPTPTATATPAVTATPDPSGTATPAPTPCDDDHGDRARRGSDCSTSSEKNGASSVSSTGKVGTRLSLPVGGGCSLSVGAGSPGLWILCALNVLGLVLARRRR